MIDASVPLISAMILIPLLCSCLIAFHKNEDRAQLYGLVGSIANFALSIICMHILYQNHFEYCLIEKYECLNVTGIGYQVGVDGISGLLICLTTLIHCVCGMLINVEVKDRRRFFVICMLLLQSCTIGTFASINIMAFFVFFELILLPMYLIISIWGGPNKKYAATKFLLYTIFGSVFFLIATIILYTSVKTLNILDVKYLTKYIPLFKQKILWLGIFIALAVKVPMLPFHTWLPDAHVQAPTLGSGVLAGVLLKIGGYGMIRFLLPLFPEVSAIYSPFVLMLSAITIVYASFVAFGQTDIKKVVAYSSVAHMGYVTAGIFSLNTYGVSGAMFQMLSHGIVSCGLFLVVGALYRRTHTRQITDYGGIAQSMPTLIPMFLVLMFSSVGLPGTSGFVGEILTVIATFKVSEVAGCIMSLGVVFGAVYMLNLYKKVMNGPLVYKDLSQLCCTEKLALWILSILTVLLGIFPCLVSKPLVGPIDYLMRII